MEVDFKQSLLKDKDGNILISSNRGIGRDTTDTHMNNMTTDEMQMQINYLRRRLSSFSMIENEEKQSTLSTALIICNNTIGSACMILPIIFNNCGIINCLLIMILIGIAQFATCKLCILHLRPDEPDIPQIIDRLLTRTWKALFVLSSVIFEFLCGIVYLILMNNMLYPILIFIFEKCGFENYAKKSENRYDIFSFQINAWIFLIPIYLTCYIKDIKIITIISKIGIYVLVSFVIFLIYIFVDNVASGRLMENLHRINYVSSNITEASGALSLAFFIHNCVCPLIKNIEDKNEGQKAVGLSYVFTFIFYFLIGIIGYFGILGRNTVDDYPQTIMDYFAKESIFPFIIEIFYFLKLMTVYPLFCFVTRNQFFALIFENKNKGSQTTDPHKKIADSHWIAGIIYNTTYIGVSMVCVLYNINLTFIMGLTGAVFGFILVYVIPIGIHLKCFYFSGEKQALCNPHPEKNNESKWTKIILYVGIVGLFGLYLMIIQLIQLFSFDWLKE